MWLSTYPVWGTMTLSITAFRKTTVSITIENRGTQQIDTQDNGTQYCSAECHFCWLSQMSQLCWVSLHWVSLCWVSLCWVSLSWVSLCWVLWSPEWSTLWYYAWKVKITELTMDQHSSLFYWKINDKLMFYGIGTWPIEYVHLVLML
jgi:hypothetical protein